MLKSEQSFDDAVLPQDRLDVDRSCNFAVALIDQFLQPSIPLACKKTAERVVYDYEPLEEAESDL